MNLKLSNISKSYGEKKILDNISFEVSDGELFSILGESGAGKSTLLKVIAGLLEPDSGEIFIDGLNITNLQPEKRCIPYIFQQPLLFPHMSVKRNIAFSLEIRKCDKKSMEDRVNNLMELLKIKELADRMPSEISGGQQQRVAIARAIAVENPIILMDEPFSSLDTELRREMGALIKSIQEKLGIAIIFVTHDRNESLALSHKIALLDNGSLLQIGSPEEIYYKPINKVAAEFMGVSNLIPISCLKDVSCDLQLDSHMKLENDKDCCVFFRPHQLKIDKNKSDFLIAEQTNFGKEKILKITNGKFDLYVETFSDEEYFVGSKVGIKLPDKKFHLVNS